MAFLSPSPSSPLLADAGSAVPSYLRQRPAANRAWRQNGAGWAQTAQLRAIRGGASTAAAAHATPAAAAPALRVVHVCKPPADQPAAGRFALSGRLADVCAELDRLAAHEARSAGG
ncbi:MAG: hypothetical protein R3E70_02525 [Burkholderiaceae bacterium]